MCAVSEDGVLLWLCMGLGWDLLLCSGGAAVTQPWSCFTNTTSKAAAKGSKEDYSQEWGSQRPVPLAGASTTLCMGVQHSPSRCWRAVEFCCSFQAAQPQLCSRFQYSSGVWGSKSSCQPCKASARGSTALLTPGPSGTACTALRSAGTWPWGAVPGSTGLGAGAQPYSQCPAPGHRPIQSSHSLNLHRTKQNTLSCASAGCY